MSSGGFEFDGNLKRWQKFLLSLEKEKVASMKDRILRTSGLRGLEYAEDLVPVRTGRLKGSLSVGDRDNVFVVHVSRKESEVLFGSAVDYAKHANDGFKQKAGQFVPGEWKSGHFHYRPELYPEGMVLTGKEIEGAHYFDKAVEYLEEDIPDIIEFEIRRLWHELWKGGK